MKLLLFLLLLTACSTAHTPPNISSPASSEGQESIVFLIDESGVHCISPRDYCDKWRADHPEEHE